MSETMSAVVKTFEFKLLKQIKTERRLRIYSLFYPKYMDQNVFTFHNNYKYTKRNIELLSKFNLEN
jgi:hypothetical protein